jgi:hypothetical protein
MTETKDKVDAFLQDDRCIMTSELCAAQLNKLKITNSKGSAKQEEESGTLPA